MKYRTIPTQKSKCNLGSRGFLALGELGPKLRAAGARGLGKRPQLSESEKTSGTQGSQKAEGSIIGSRTTQFTKRLPKPQLNRKIHSTSTLSEPILMYGHRGKTLFLPCGHFGLAAVTEHSDEFKAVLIRKLNTQPRYFQILLLKAFIAT